MSNSNELKDILADMHLALAEDLLEKIQSGVATPGELSIACKMLKDNNITLDLETKSDSDPLQSILTALPTIDELEIPDRNEFTA